MTLHEVGGHVINKSQHGYLGPCININSVTSKEAIMALSLSASSFNIVYFFLGWDDKRDCIFYVGESKCSLASRQKKHSKNKWYSRMEEAFIGVAFTNYREERWSEEARKAIEAGVLYSMKNDYGVNPENAVNSTWSGGPNFSKFNNLEEVAYLKAVIVKIVAYISHHGRLSKPPVQVDVLTELVPSPPVTKPIVIPKTLTSAEIMLNPKPGREFFASYKSSFNNFETRVWAKQMENGNLALTRIQNIPKVILVGGKSEAVIRKRHTELCVDALPNSLGNYDWTGEIESPSVTHYLSAIFGIESSSCRWKEIAPVRPV